MAGEARFNDETEVAQNCFNVKSKFFWGESSMSFENFDPGE